MTMKFTTSPKSGQSQMPRIIANLIGVVLLIALAASVSLPQPAAAQEIRGLDTQQRENVPAGPYTVTVEAKPLPSLQAAQFFITVDDAATGAPAGDVKVQVLASLQGTDEHGYAHATLVDTPGVFTATLIIETPGVWETDLLLEAPDGSTYGAEGFDLEVIAPTAQREAARLEAGLIYIGVAVILLAGSAYLVWQIRRTQRRRAVGGGDAAV